MLPYLFLFLAFNHVDGSPQVFAKFSFVVDGEIIFRIYTGRFVQINEGDLCGETDIVVCQGLHQGIPQLILDLL